MKLRPTAVYGSDNKEFILHAIFAQKAFEVAQEDDTFDKPGKKMYKSLCNLARRSVGTENLVAILTLKDKSEAHIFEFDRKATDDNFYPLQKDDEGFYIEIEDEMPEKKPYKPTIVFDLDGVIHSYKSGWKGAENITDEPIEGINDVIQDLRKDYYVVVVSSRCATESGLKAVENYLHNHNIEVDGVMKEKPPAIVYVDDRAICFDGKAEGLADKIRQFKSWLEQSK